MSTSISDQPGSGRGKRWAYTGAIVGGVVSVLANIAHSFVPGQPSGLTDEAWRSLGNAAPQPGAVLLAAFWPSALLLAIEVLARVDWPGRLRWTLVRWGGVTPVAVVAAVVSYRHLSGLLHWYGEDPVTVTLGPAAVDGLMVVSTGALLALAVRMAPVAAVADPIGEPLAPVVGSVGSVGLAGRLGRMDGSSTRSVGSPDRVDGSEPVGSGGQSDGSDGWVASLALVPDRVESAARAARPKDLDRARAAIEAGDLTHPLTADRIRDSLKIGLEHARAVRDTLRDEAPADEAEA